MMSKTGKTLSIIGGTLAVLLIAAVALPPLISTETVREQIQLGVSRATGLDLQLAENPRLRLLPRPRLSASAITLQGTANRFSELHLQARRLTLDLELLSLLIGRVQPADLVVDGLDLRLPAGPPGVGSWRLGAGQIRLVPDAGPLPSPDSPTPPPIERLELHGGWAERRDPGGSPPLRLTGLELQGGPLAVDQPGPISGHGQIDMPAVISGAIGLEATLGIGPSALVLTSEALKIGPLRPIAVRLETRLVPVADGIDATALSLTGERVRIDGEVRLRNPWTEDAHPALAGRLHLHEVDLRSWLTELGLTSLPGNQTTLRRVAMSTNLRLDPPRRQANGALAASFRLGQTQIDVDETRADAKLNLRSGTEGRRMVFELRMDRLALDPWLVPWRQPKPAVRAPAMAPRPGAATAPGTTAAEVASVGQTATAPQPNREDRADAPVKRAREASTPQQAPSPPPPRVPTAINGRIQLGQLSLAGLRAEDVSSRIAAEDRRLEIGLAAARVLGGKLAGQMHLDGSSPDEPQLAFTASANAVQLAPLLETRFAKAPISGTADISADLKAVGGDATRVRESLSGSLSLLARDGRIRGIGLINSIIRSAGGNAADGDDLTLFSRFSATAKGEHGRFRSDDIQGESPMLSVSGRGELDLPTERIDVRLTSVLREPPSGAGIAELEGLPIPVRIAGHWRRPAVQVDTRSLLREAGRRALERELDRRGDKLEERIGIPGLEQGLRELLGL